MRAAAEDTIPGLLERAGRERPGTWAVVSGTNRSSYAELCATTHRTASALVELGVDAGDRVGLWATNSPDWITFALATLEVGAVLVPFSTRSPVDEVRGLLDRAGCTVVAASTTFRDTAPAADLARAFPGPVIAVGPESVAGAVPWRDLTTHADDGIVGERIAALRPDQPSHILFTSGSTGLPKGVVLRHGAMVATTRAWVEIVGLGPDDRYPIVNPLSHIGGFKTGLVASLLAGATAYPLPVFDPGALLDLIHGEGLTVMQAPPTVFQDLIGQTRETSRGPTPLRVAVTGSAQISPQLVRDINDVLGAESVITAYGLTENTGVVTMTRRGDPIEVTATTSGRIIEGVRLRIEPGADDAGHPHRSGEILVAGTGLMSGYLDDPAATAAALDDGWLQTGDVGWLDEQGNLHIVDRLKDLVIVGGFNVYPAEVERALTDHDDVEAAGVVGLPDDRLGEVPVAFVVAAADRHPDAVQLADFCKVRLAGYKVPRRVWVVEELPRTAIGKVDKGALRSDAQGRVAQ